MWYLSLVQRPNTEFGSMPMYCDDQSTIYIAKNLVFHYQTKHIEVDCNLVRDVWLKVVSLLFTPSSQQPAVGAAAFIFFDHSWKDLIPDDKTGNFEMMYDFLKQNWKIAKWVALGVVILEALVFLLAIAVRAANKPPEYDSDEEYINPGSSVRQPLINNNRQGVTATGVPVAGTLDQRPSRNDAWSQRMREKYGLDTSKFTYNPSESGRFPQEAAAPAEERGKCTIL